jgi:hypothetical protein
VVHASDGHRISYSGRFGQTTEGNPIPHISNNQHAPQRLTGANGFTPTQFSNTGVWIAAHCDCAIPGDALSTAPAAGATG